MTTNSQPDPELDHHQSDLTGQTGLNEKPGDTSPGFRPDLTRVLRWAGGAVLVSAAVAFMYQGLYATAPMTRHWIMLAICALLGLLGIITGIMLREEKGARAFLGFAAASFPVLASQLGAMFYSLVGQPPPGMPQPLVFSLMTTSKVFAVAGLTLAVVVPASYLAFRILARSRALLLTTAFSLVNLIILLPVRQDVAWGGVLITTIALAIYFVDSLWLRSDFRLDNFEGRVSRFLFAIPLGVMAGRAFFYPVGSSFCALMLGLAGAYLAFHWGRTTKQAGTRVVCQLTGQLGLTTAWLTFLLPRLDYHALSDGMAVYETLLPIGVLLAAQSLATGGRTAAKYRNTAAGVISLSVAIAHWTGATPLVSVAGVLIALATLSFGTLTGEKPVFTCGVLAAAVSLGNFGLQAIRLHSNYAWVALAFIGIGVIFSASIIEKVRTLPHLNGSSLWGRLKT